MSLYQWSMDAVEIFQFKLSWTVSCISIARSTARATTCVMWPGEASRVRSSVCYHRPTSTGRVRHEVWVPMINHFRTRGKSAGLCSWARPRTSKTGHPISRTWLWYGDSFWVTILFWLRVMSLRNVGITAHLAKGPGKVASALISCRGMNCLDIKLQSVFHSKDQLLVRMENRLVRFSATVSTKNKILLLEIARIFYF